MRRPSHLGFRIKSRRPTPEDYRLNPPSRPGGFRKTNSQLAETFRGFSGRLENARLSLQKKSVPGLAHVFLLHILLFFRLCFIHCKEHAKKVHPFPFTKPTN